MTDAETDNDTLPDEISIIWCIEDVKELRPDLTDDQARQVLHQAKRCHDADCGISWAVLLIHSRGLFGYERDEEGSDEGDSAGQEGGAA